MGTLIRALIYLHLITPTGITRLIRAFLAEGITLMALLRFARSYYPDKTALVDESATWTYREWYLHARNMAATLYTHYALRPHHKVAVLCRNHVSVAALLPALSRLGVSIKLLNTDMGDEQLCTFLKQHPCKYLITDRYTQASDQLNACETPLLSVESLTTLPLISNTLPKIRRGGNISVYSGGSSGSYTEAARQSHCLPFLFPFITLLKNIRIHRYNGILLTLPLYHGFGLASFAISLLMGKKMVLLPYFEANKVIHFLQKEQIEAFPAVPAMLTRLWKDPVIHNTSLKCIISGGDTLDKNLVQTIRQSSDIEIYNLFGTSEVGFCMLATTHDLLAFNETTLGKPFLGVSCKLKDIDAYGTGTLFIHTRWMMNGHYTHFINTGDRVFKNEDGYYFYRGRADKMVVCGGENVYPEHVEQILRSHPDIIDCIVNATPHPQFGQVLHANIEVSPGFKLTETMLKQWLRPQLSRAAIPHTITFKRIELLSTGKRKPLKSSPPIIETIPE